jgi:uncharacterized membrane protein YeiH
MLALRAEALDGPFEVPLALDYAATFTWAVSGALVAARRGYDLAGILLLALVASTGGGLIRDGLFIQAGPPLLVRSPVYLALVAVAALIVLLVGSRVQRARHLGAAVALVDAFGLGAYAVVGMQLAANAGINAFGVVLVGVLNAVGGGLLRDVLMRREPDLFRPGAPLATAALLGCVLFLALTRLLGVEAALAGWVTIAVVFAVRALAVRYGVRTMPALGFEPEREEGR